MPSQGFLREGLAAEGSAEITITSEAIRVAELPAADPLTSGLTVVACQLLTKERRLLDDVDGAGLRCRRRSLRLRRSRASCAGFGSSDEANSGEQRNDETHRYTLLERRHRAAGNQGSAARFAADRGRDIETTVKRLESEADAARVKLDTLNKAEDASWAAMRSALAETRAALDHAHRSVLDALERCT
jgi:hypothetical protein